MDYRDTMEALSEEKPLFLCRKPACLPTALLRVWGKELMVTTTLGGRFSNIYSIAYIEHYILK